MNLRELEIFCQQEHSTNVSMFDVMQTTILGIQKRLDEEIAALREIIHTQGLVIDQLTVSLHRYQHIDQHIAELRTITHQTREDVDMMSMDIDDFGFDYEVHVSQEHSGLSAKIEALEEKVGARNKSAAVKRNMTDDDARRVLNGDQKDINHKEAGSNIGLTYAQVYSCRMEFTFKHVHKELRDSGWRNPWKQ
jgi:hypothetical protein